MKIGDEVYIHGYVDEIRGDTVIIKNEGGYFGTSKKEIVSNMSETIYEADKFITVIDEKFIRLIRKDDPCISVIIDRMPQTDCPWR